VDISVKLDSRNCIKYLNNIAAKQIPYASAIALNDIAFEVKGEEVVALKQHLDRPTPFTQRAYDVVKANKARIVASVRARAVQSEYLKWQVDGGSRAPAKVANVIPADVGRNAYGNMRTGVVKRMIADKGRYFSGRPRGHSAPAGIWQRLGGKGSRRDLRLMVAYDDSVKYKKILPFEDVARKTVTKIAPGKFSKALDKAIASAR